MRLWDLDKESKEPKQLGRMGGPLVAFSLSGDGKTLATASGDNQLRIFDFPKGDERNRFGGHTGGMLALARTPDGKTLITGGRDKIVRLWEVETGKPRGERRGHGGWVEALALSADGKVLATGAGDGLVRLWDSSGRFLTRLSGHVGPVKTLAFGDGVLASGGADTTVVLWDVSAILRDAKPQKQTLTEDRLGACWKDLASEDGDRAYQTVQSLILAGDQAVTLFDKRIKPVSTEQLAKLLSDLDNEDPPKREKAQVELESMGRVIEPALRKALASNPTPHAKLMLTELLALLDDKRFSPHRVRELRAVEVLEGIGTPAAKEALTVLAKGAPGAEVTIDAILGHPREQQPAAQGRVAAALRPLLLGLPRRPRAVGQYLGRLHGRVRADPAVRAVHRERGGRDRPGPLVAVLLARPRWRAAAWRAGGRQIGQTRGLPGRRPSAPQDHGGEPVARSRGRSSPKGEG